MSALQLLAYSAPAIVGILALIYGRWQLHRVRQAKIARLAAREEQTYSVTASGIPYRF